MSTLQTTILKHPDSAGSQVTFASGGDINFDNGAVYIDSSNNRLGVGTTSPSGPLAVHQAASSTANYINITNSATGASSWANGMLVGVSATGDALCWQTESSSLRFGTNNVEAMRLDGSGFVGINNSSPSSYNSDGRNLVVGSGSGGQGLTIASGTSGYGNIYFADGTSGNAMYRGMLSYNHADDHMQFRTASEERMRINSSGNIFFTSGNVGVTGKGGANTAFYVTDTANSNAQTVSINANGSVTLAGTLEVGLNNPSGTSRFYRKTTSTGVGVMQIESDIGSTRRDQMYVDTQGSVFNRTGTFTSYSSDERLKKDIVDAPSQWEDIKNIRMRKFRYKVDSDDAQLQLGVIAQELEPVCPNLILRKIANAEVSTESEGLIAEGEDVLNWKQSIVHLKALKALQEAMERIEQLEAKVAALEAG